MNDDGGILKTGTKLTVQGRPAVAVRVDARTGLVGIRFRDIPKRKLTGYKGAFDCDTYLHRDSESLVIGEAGPESAEIGELTFNGD